MKLPTTENIMKRAALLAVLLMLVIAVTACGILDAKFGERAKIQPRQVGDTKQTLVFPVNTDTTLDAIVTASRKLNLKADTRKKSGNVIILYKEDITPYELDNYCLSPFVSSENGNSSGSFLNPPSRSRSGYVSGRFSFEIILHDKGRETIANTYSQWTVANLRSVPQCQSNGSLEKEIEQAIIQIIKNPLPAVINADGTPKASLKGIAVGTSRTALLENFPGFSCIGKRCELLPSAAEKGLESHALFSLGSALVNVYRVSLYEDKLGYMSATFSQRWHANVKRALTEKYGAPTREKTETVQNRYGATYINHITTWEIGEDSIQLEDLGVDLETSVVRLFAKWYPVAEEIEMKEKAKEDARNL
jgi:hypothetical protein